jgi:UDP-N-acetylglucosamine 1-carboxyvinyltransferase
MEHFEVEGGLPLSGTIRPQGAKNEALQVICATLLTAEAVTLSNLPDILDVRRLVDLLEALGVGVTRHDAHKVTLQAAEINFDYLDSPEGRANVMKLRGSVMLMGPLLARFGKVAIPKPGGDKIGRRPIDVHLNGLRKLGASLDVDRPTKSYRLSAPGRLTGADMLLPEASVTGTANLVMAAVLAEGTTSIYNAACEPYLQQLCAMLVRMGAHIEGIGSNLLTIHGVDSLGGTDHRLLADMIEVGSFIGVSAMTASPLTIAGADVHQLGLIPDTFERLGIPIEIRGNDLYVDPRQVARVETYLDGSILTIADHTWPGLTPDLLSVLLVTATQCQGTVLIHQKMFESRLFFTDKLIDMGAQIILCDPHRATVIGLGREKPLHATTMTSPDIRAGVALLIAALSAQGTSKIFNIEQIDRGYERIDARLNALGAGVKRVK